MPFNLLANNRLLDQLEHLLTAITHFSLVEFIMLKAFKFDAIFFEFCLFVIISFFIDKDIMFESCFYFLIYIKVIDQAFNHLLKVYMIFLSGLAILCINKNIHFWHLLSFYLIHFLIRLTILLFYDF